MNISVSTSGQRYYYSKEILAGSSHAIVTDTQIVSAQDILTAFDRMPVAENERALVNTENVFKDKYIGNLLNLIGKAYFAQLDIESKILANAQNIYAERYISVGVFSYTPTFIENLGAVRELDQGGYSVDIIGNNCAAVSLDGNETSEKSYYFGAGYVSSYFETSVYKGYKQDKIEMRGDRAEMSDFPLYLNTVAGGLDRRDQTIGGFSFVVKIYALPVVEIIG